MGPAYSFYIRMQSLVERARNGNVDDEESRLIAEKAAEFYERSKGAVSLDGVTPQRLLTWQKEIISDDRLRSAARIEIITHCLFADLSGHMGSRRVRELYTYFWGLLGHPQDVLIKVTKSSVRPGGIATVTLITNDVSWVKASIGEPTELFRGKRIVMMD